MSGGFERTSSWRWAGNVQSSDVSVIVDVRVVEGEESNVTFFRRSGRRAGMSVAVYLRTRGLSASARSPVPALFIYLFFMSDLMRGCVCVRDIVYSCGWGEGHFLEIRTRVQECEIDGAFHS